MKAPRTDQGSPRRLEAEAEGPEATFTPGMEVFIAPALPGEDPLQAKVVEIDEAGNVRLEGEGISPDIFWNSEIVGVTADEALEKSQVAAAKNG